MPLALEFTFLVWLISSASSAEFELIRLVDNDLYHAACRSTGNYDIRYVVH